MSFFQLAGLLGKLDKEECTSLIYLSRWMGRQGGRDDAVIWRDLKDSLGLREDRFLPAGWMVRLVYEDRGRIKLFIKD